MKRRIELLTHNLESFQLTEGFNNSTLTLILPIKHGLKEGDLITITREREFKEVDPSVKIESLLEEVNQKNIEITKKNNVIANLHGSVEAHIKDILNLKEQLNKERKPTPPQSSIVKNSCPHRTPLEPTTIKDFCKQNGLPEQPVTNWIKTHSSPTPPTTLKEFRKLHGLSKKELINWLNNETEHYFIQTYKQFRHIRKISKKQLVQWLNENYTK